MCSGGCGGAGLCCNDIPGEPLQGMGVSRGERRAGRGEGEVGRGQLHIMLGAGKQGRLIFLAKKGSLKTVKNKKWTKSNPKQRTQTPSRPEEN